MRIKKLLCSILAITIVLSTMSFSVFAEEVVRIETAGPTEADQEIPVSETSEMPTEEIVAKVDEDEYASIDNAIAAWTAGTTLTLLADVTLSDVITLDSTEHHILDLGTYTMTAGSGKHAIEIVPKGAGTAARNCLTINADSTNPGGITATGKSCIYYTNASKIADRLTVTINGGVFEGSYAINSASGPRNSIGVTTSPIRGQSAPYYVLNGGTFNATVLINAGMLKMTGGIYNKGFTCNGDSTAYRLIYGGKFKSLPTLTHDAEGKLVFGTEKGVYNAYIYIDDEGYYVVDTEMPTESFEASSKGAYNSMFQYSAIANEGVVYCTSAEYAMENLKDVKLYVPYTEDKAVKSGSTFTVDATENAFTGDVTITKTGVFVIKYNEETPYEGTVVNNTDMYGVKVTDIVDGGIVTKTYTGYEIIDETNGVLMIADGDDVEYFKSFDKAAESLYGTTGKTITLIKDVNSIFINYNSYTSVPTEFTLDLNGNKITATNINGNTFRGSASITFVDNSIYKNGAVTKDILSKIAKYGYIPVVKGGTWYADPSGYIAEGYGAFETDDGYFVRRDAEQPLVELYAPVAAATFSVDSANMVLVGTYESLEEAIEDSQAGYLIKLIADIELEDTVTINKDVTIDINDFTLATAGDEEIVVASEVDIIGGVINSDITVESGHLALESVEAHGEIAVNNAGDMEVSSGWFKHLIADEYIAEGFDIVRTANGYVIITEGEQADTISVEYKDVTVPNTEGEKTYEIVVKANNNDYINELASVDLSFVYTTTPVTGGAIDFTVSPAEKFAMTRYENTNRYMFNYNGVDAFEETAAEITVGTITVTGYGEFTIATADVDTNVVNATTINDNLVDSYTAVGATDDDATTGGLDISDKVDGNEAVIAVPTRTLTINIDFPNEVKDNAIAYQDMKVEITGNIEGVNKTVTYDLGEGMVDGSYVVTEDKLVLNNAYTVTVSGAGYRTARYTVTMTENKELTFWNNVMDEAKVIETGKTSSAVTKNFLAGDIVRDNNINIYDLSAVVSYFATETDTLEYSDYAKYDLNRDGVIDSKDVAYVLVSWNN